MFSVWSEYLSIKQSHVLHNSLLEIKLIFGPFVFCMVEVTGVSLLLDSVWRHQKFFYFIWYFQYVRSYHIIMLATRLILFYTSQECKGTVYNTHVHTCTATMFYLLEDSFNVCHHRWAAVYGFSIIGLQTCHIALKLFESSSAMKPSLKHILKLSKDMKHWNIYKQLIWH